MELSKQEYRIARLLTLGHTEKEIANELYISPKTVNNHSYNIRKKWNARNAVDVARKFILSLDNPKKYFAAVTFLMIQGLMIAECDLGDMRRPLKTRAKISRNIKQ